MNNLTMDPVTLFEVRGTVGLGKEGDPVRVIVTYFDKDGAPVLELDPFTGFLIFKGEEFKTTRSQDAGSN